MSDQAHLAALPSPAEARHRIGGAVLVLPTPADLDGVPFQHLPAIITQLASLQSAAAMRLHRATAIPEAARLLTAAETADILHVAIDWVEKRSRTLPFRVSLADGTVRYDPVGLRRWLAARTGAVR